MPLRLDHIVIAVHDLQQARADYAALGFTVLEGGSHPGRPTHNALVVFEDGVYFELIAWREPAPQERWWQWLQRHGEGIVDVALLPQDVATVVAQAHGRGLAYSGPHDGGRLRPDGAQLRWQTARPDRPDLPFLCGDLSPRTLRVPEGAARIHANGATGVAGLSIAVSDLESSLARWRALLGPGIADTARSGALPGLGLRAARIPLGQSHITLVSPHPSHALYPLLRQRGDGPFAIALATRDAARAGTSADATRTHGAPIEFETPPFAA